MTSGRHLLMVGGDERLAETLHLHDGFRLTRADTGARALAEVAPQSRARGFMTVFVDVELPDMDGRDVCRLMRRRGLVAPVILIGRAGSDADVIWGLDAGADDYVVRPYRMGVLLARLRAQIRAHERSGEAEFIVGPYVFQPSRKLLRQGDGADDHVRRIRLADKETAILKYLCRTGGQFVSRDELLSEVWGYPPGIVTNTVETHAYRLRQKLEPDPANPSILVSKPGGFRLVA
ncbi:MAG: response regulator transcription factor [Magnetovibrio sp.]|nr:response regulator transcription factor [Magnetovibrio sp.]